MSEIDQVHPRVVMLFMSEMSEIVINSIYIGFDGMAEKP